MAPKKESLTETVGLASKNDVPLIHELVNKYLEENPENKKEDGFLAYNPTEEELYKIVSELGVVVDKKGKEIKGYLMMLTPELAQKTEFFGELLGKLDDFLYKNKKLSQYNFCILAQIAISKEHRNSGTFKNLHSFTNFIVRQKGYEIGIGEIDDRNRRSLLVHTKLAGMKDVGVYKAKNGKK